MSNINVQLVDGNITVQTGENTALAAQYAADAAAQVALAESEADRAEAAALEAEGVVATVDNLRRNVLINGDMPIGWIDPADYPDVTWTSGFAHRRYSDGLTVWCMLPDDDTTRSAWRLAGSPRVRHPADGKYYVGVNMAAVYNPVLAGDGAMVVERYVDVNTGSNGNAGTFAAQWKTVDYAIAQINALGAGTYRIWVTSSDFIPSNSEGWNATSFTLVAGVKLSIVVLPKVDGTQPWYLPGMRRSGYLAANWAFTNIGDGWYKATTASISAAAKNTPVAFDLSVLDADGNPTPLEALTGVLVDDAAVKAAAMGRPAFYRRVSDNHFYIKLPSGTAPVPGTNFAYVESQTSIAFLLGEGCRLHIKGMRQVNNTSVVNGVGIQIRPTTVTLGPTAPVVEHDIHAVLEECEFIGTSGNGIVAFDVARCVIWNCKTAYNWLDGVNQSTYYTPGNSNGTAMGAAQHMLIYNHVDFQHGPNGFKDQPTVNTSSNGPTTHSRCNMEVLNSRFFGSNGSNAAVVGGAKMLAVNSRMDMPKFVTPASDVYTAAWLASGNSAYDVNIKSEIIGLYCTGTTGATGRDFYVGPTAKMTMIHYRRHSYTKQVDSGGQLLNGYGTSL